MPLHDVSYDRFQGPRINRAARSWALARSSLTLLLRQRRFLFLLAACWLPAVVRAVQIYLARQLPDSVPFLEVNPALWKDFLSQQVRFLLVVAVALYAGSGAISSDLRTLRNPSARSPVSRPVVVVPSSHLLCSVWATSPRTRPASEISDSFRTGKLPDLHRSPSA